MASIINASSSGSGGIVQTADASGVLQLQTNGTVAVNIDTSARVGVGLTTVTEKFEVNGSINASTASSNNFSLGSARAMMDYVPGSNTARFGQVNGASGLTTGKLGLYSNGVESIAINSAGAVSTPLQPSFEAYNSTDNTYNGTAQSVPMVYNATYRNVGSHYNTANGVFTAPVAGYYTFFAGAYASNTAITQIWCIQNGGRTVSMAIKPIGGTPGDTISGCATVYLAANDTFGVFAYSASATNPQTLFSNPYHTFFKGFLLG